MSSHENTRIAAVPQEEAFPLFASLQPQFGLPKTPSDMDETQKRMAAGDVTLFAAYAGEDIVSYAFYNRAPRYKPFARLDIPEIQDLNTHPDHRGQGLATRLVAACEDLARDEGRDMIGLGVGLHAGYGPAQRLYCKLGYLPDGAGLVYDAQFVDFDVAKPNDDDLCIMMVKSL